MLLFLLINFSVQWLQRVDAFFKRLSLDLEFSKFLKVFPSPLHQMFHWNIKNMTKELQSIINCIKWKREPNYDRELSNCNFLQSQTSTPVERFCKPGWHKLHQQYVSIKYKQKHTDSITWWLIDSRTGIHFSGRTH